jgi:hypothetical protein
VRVAMEPELRKAMSMLSRLDYTDPGLLDPK